MVPSRSQVINGPRPSPLKIGEGSHCIRKPKKPVIIYAHSPKVIHTRAQDFMALVQRLTGLSRDDESECPEPQMRRNPNGENDQSSSVLTEEANGVSCCVGEEHVSNSNKSSFGSPGKQYLADVPLFTPGSMALLCYSNPGLRYPDPELYLPPNTPNCVSPSVFDFMKRFPDF